MGDVPPVLSIIGTKNSGKTSLLVALAAELRRRGRRIASVKHGHHGFEIDQPGRDSWRHLHEGGTEAVLIVSAEKVALVMRTPQEEAPEALIRRFYGGRGYDLVLVEGYKHGPFPKVEVHRRAVHDAPVHRPGAPGAELYLAIVTDDPDLAADCPLLALDPRGPEGGHVAAVADRVEDWLGSLEENAG